MRWSAGDVPAMIAPLAVIFSFLFGVIVAVVVGYYTISAMLSHGWRPMLAAAIKSVPDDRRAEFIEGIDEIVSAWCGCGRPMKGHPAHEVDGVRRYTHSSEQDEP